MTNNRLSALIKLNGNKSVNLHRPKELQRIFSLSHVNAYLSSRTAAETLQYINIGSGYIVHLGNALLRALVVTPITQIGNSISQLKTDILTTLAYSNSQLVDDNAVAMFGLYSQWKPGKALSFINQTHIERLKKKHFPSIDSTFEAALCDSAFLKKVDDHQSLFSCECKICDT